MKRLELKLFNKVTKFYVTDNGSYKASIELSKRTIVNVHKCNYIDVQYPLIHGTIETRMHVIFGFDHYTIQAEYNGKSEDIRSQILTQLNQRTL